MLLRQAANARRQAQHLEVGDVLGNHAEGERDVAALPKRVDPEAREIVFLVGDVQVAARLEGLEPLGRAFADELEDALGIAVGDHRRLLERGERTVAPEDRRNADLQVDVARAELDGASEQEIEFHGGHSCIGSRNGGP